MIVIIIHTVKQLHVYLCTEVQVMYKPKYNDQHMKYKTLSYIQTYVCMYIHREQYTYKQTFLPYIVVPECTVLTE